MRLVRIVFSSRSGFGVPKRHRGVVRWGVKYPFYIVLEQDTVDLGPISERYFGSKLLLGSNKVRSVIGAYFLHVSSSCYESSQRVNE